MNENNTKNLLINKTKEELLNIIFRKDATELALSAKIKELQAQINMDAKKSIKRFQRKD